MMSLFSFLVIYLFARIRASPPLALHQLIEVEASGEVVLELHGHDLEGDKVRSFSNFIHNDSIEKT